MLATLMSLMLLTVLLWIGFKLTGALLLAFVWLFIKLPLSILIGGLGLLCCCTILLIPVGWMLMKSGMRILIS
ncbi:MAG: hypothetical protein Q4B03_05665 [Lachnospiraceae bacterium]|nr:hypothetical protein [Lachnospiraceae bacterium]